MSLTSEEIEFMDKEVERDMEEQDIVEDMEDTDDIEFNTRIRRRSTDSEDSLNGKCVREKCTRSVNIVL